METKSPSIVVRSLETATDSVRLAQLFKLDDSPNATIITMLKKSAKDLDKVIQDITTLTDDLMEP